MGKMCFSVVFSPKTINFDAFNAFFQKQELDLESVASSTPVYATLHDITATSTFRQDAQLSQRDCGAGCVIVFAKSRRLELGTIFYGHYRSSFNHCDTVGLKICRIRWKNAK